jgi:hypothetical protein|uniref:SET domain-containing protein n=1 Tax=viral metagenome TaxID=1070528 RepID=A0A6C0EH06_9ZZZZ
MRLNIIKNNLPYSFKNIQKNSIIETGIMRNININNNSDYLPFLINKKYDFKPVALQNIFKSPYFLISGNGMFFPKSYNYANCFLSVKFDIVNYSLDYNITAITNIRDDTPLILYTDNKSNIMLNIDNDYNKKLNISEDQLDRYFRIFKDQDSQRDIHYNEIKNHINKIQKNQIQIVDNNSKIALLKHSKFTGYGVFATDNIKSGEVIEWGLQRKIDNLDGDKCPYVFTWNSCGKKLADKNKWTTGSGNAIFYNSDINPNTRMYRFYDDYFYMIVASKDIQKGEELTHYYVSSNWRECFVNDFYLPKNINLEI